MIVAVFDSANALRFQPEGGVPECGADAVKFCNAVIYNFDKRLACMRAHRAQLSPECIAAIRAKR